MRLWSGVSLTLFRSAPPCGGRPDVLVWVQDLALVSIRAPVRGATNSQRRA